MALVTRKSGKQYYYRSRREGDRVVREYVAFGDSARIAAERDAQQRSELAAERQAITASHQRIHEVLDAVDEFCDSVRTLAAGILVQRGCHQHDRGHCHKKRETNE